MKRYLWFIFAISLFSLVGICNPSFADPTTGIACTSGGSKVISSGMLFTCEKTGSGFKWSSGSKCTKIGDLILVNRQKYTCVRSGNSRLWVNLGLVNKGNLDIEILDIDSSCFPGIHSAKKTVQIKFTGKRTQTVYLNRTKNTLSLSIGEYRIFPTPVICGNQKYSPISQSFRVGIKGNLTTNLAIRYQDNFDQEFSRLTGLDRDAWDEKVNSDPLTYKIYYKNLKTYARGPLCSYMSSGVDDYTLGAYISNEVSFLQNIQNALLAATRIAFGCSN